MASLPSLPNEIAESFAKSFYKSLCVHVLLGALGDDIYTEEIIQKILPLIEYDPDDLENVN